MADYIKSNILCQAYVNIKRSMPSELEQQRLGKSLKEFVETRSKFFLYEEVESKVEFKDGSIIEYLTVAGSLYVMISQYPKFREGVISAYGDVKRLADSMILEALFVTKAKNTEINRIEARTGVIGLLSEIVDSLDNIQASLGLVKVLTVTARLSKTLSDTIRLLDSLSDPRDINLVSENVKEIVFAYPQTIKDTKEKTASTEDISKWRATIKHFIDKMDHYKSKAQQGAALNSHSPGA
jgi:hypothetical protein